MVSGVQARRGGAGIIWVWASMYVEICICVMPTSSLAVRLGVLEDLRYDAGADCSQEQGDVRAERAQVWKEGTYRSCRPRGA